MGQTQSKTAMKPSEMLAILDKRDVRNWYESNIERVIVNYNISLDWYKIKQQASSYKKNIQTALDRIKTRPNDAALVSFNAHVSINYPYNMIYIQQAGTISVKIQNSVYGSITHAIPLSSTDFNTDLVKYLTLYACLTGNILDNYEKACVHVMWEIYSAEYIKWYNNPANT
jgi:hypothetical protein